MRHRIADVYKAGVLAARLERHDGGTRFSYLPAYLASGGPAVASSLPLTAVPAATPLGSLLCSVDRFRDVSNPARLAQQLNGILAALGTTEGS